MMVSQNVHDEGVDSHLELWVEQGKQVSRLRDRNDLSPVELAVRADLPLALLVSIECGRRAMSEEIARKIAAALGVDSSELR